MAEGAGDNSRPPTGVPPGALTALLREVAASPEKREEEPLSLPPGTVIGRFEILRELGRGGFGVVYEATDRDLGRQVAVKVVRPGRITEEEGRVTREAEAVARLSHPNLITLFEVGRSEHGPFLVFELLRGKTLDLRMEEGPLPIREAVHVATEVARGLAHAHAEGVIHRDLKPANVFITNKGQVKILDFGMAHAFGRRRLSGGTPAYMAPEQWADAPEDERTDVFALGVMLYRMLTGDYPFLEGQGRSPAEPATVRKLDVPGAPELAELVEKMLDTNPTRRPRDGAAVLAALTPLEDRLRAKPADGKPLEHARRRKATLGDLVAEFKRRHVLPLALSVAALALATAVGGSWYAWERTAGRRRSTAVPATTPSVAVLPFVDMSSSRDLEYFGDGIAEEILNALAQVNELKVIGRTSSFSFKGKSDDLRAIGQKLDVETILEGSVRKEGNVLRITAQLVRAADGVHLWSRVFDRGEGGVLAIQEDVARAVTTALQVKLIPGQDLGAKWLRTERPDAYDQLLQGRSFQRRGTVEDSRRAMAAYEKAVAIDPGYAAAWAGIARAAVAIWSQGDEPAPQMVEKGLAAANKAVALAPDLPQGYQMRGAVRDNLLGDRAGAAQDFARAEALQPRKANEGSAATTKSSREERLRSRITLSRAEVDRDPLHPGAWTQLGYWYLAADDLGHAGEALGRALEISPAHLLASDYMCQCLEAQGRHAEALALAAGIRSPWLRLWCTAVAQHGLGHERESREALDALIARYPDQATYQIAEVHAWRGETDRAFEWLERAFQSHDTGLNMMTVAPLLRSVRADPRWGPLVEKVHGPQG
ncbi:MAG: protein kinase [Deltaproteobacteria bacterium]